jgi:putative PIN family toxin of toxin-antitoxin system
MRVVLDSNILARAAHNPHGPAGELLRCFESPVHVLILSPFLLDELDRVLRYPRLRALHGLIDDEIVEFVESIANTALIVPTPASPPAVVGADPDDDVIIATAIDGQADVLSTVDRHIHQPDVTEHCRICGVEVLTDVEWLERLRHSTNS